MIYVLVGVGVFALLVWAGRRAGPLLAKGEARIGAGVLSALAIGAGGLMSLRGAWLPGALLIVAGIGGAFAARVQRGGSAPAVRKSGMSLEEACSILGVEAGATPEEVKAAYTRLMRLAHPDKGGTSGLASQLNAARDRMLGR